MFAIPPRAWAVVLPLPLLCSASLLFAQPSGGPYGPIPQTYEVPTDAPHVWYVSPDGRADLPGRALAVPTTLDAAIQRAVTGDAIVLRGGIYRTGGLVLNQRVTLQPYRDEQPVIKGTEVAAQWEALRDGVWRTRWTKLFPSKPRDWWQRAREGMRTPLHRFNNDMVFIDGRPLQSAGWEGELTENTYSIDYEGGYVFIKVNPEGHLIEITTRDSALLVTGKTANGKAPDHQGPVIRGLTFTQFAYRALEVEGKRGSVPPTEEPTDDPVGLADPATFGKEVVGTVLENCTISHCSRVGGYFRGDKLVIRHCRVTDTSTEGIYVIGSSDCVLEHNLIARNNVEQLTGYYPAAVKIFNQTRRVIFRDNLITDNPNSNGVWYDVGNVDGVVVDNWIEGCQDGFFFEISKGVVCAGNVFANCTHGIRILNSRDARIFQNTFVNASALIERNERSNAGDHFGWHITTGPDVDQREGHRFVGNLLVADSTAKGPLLRLAQSPALRRKLTRPQVAESDFNVYAFTGDGPLVSWAPGAADRDAFEFVSLDDLRKSLPAFEAHSQRIPGSATTVLRSLDLKRYDPVRALPAGVALPADIGQILGWPPRSQYQAGAYGGGK